MTSKPVPPALPLRWTAKDLDKMSAVTFNDLVQSLVTAKKLVTPKERYAIDRFRAMGTERRLSDAEAYRRARGVLDHMIFEMQKVMRRDALRFEAGHIDIQQWQRAMAENVRKMHIASAMILDGPDAAMLGFPDGRSRQSKMLVASMRYQMRRLDRFARQVYAGKQPLGASFVARIDLYAESSRGTGEEMRDGAAKDVGLTQERRILGVADHCNGCIEEAGKGWQPIGTLLEIGDAECRMRCKCRKEFR